MLRPLRGKSGSFSWRRGQNRSDAASWGWLEGDAVGESASIPQGRYQDFGISFLNLLPSHNIYAFDGQVFLLLGVLGTAEWSLRGCRGAELVLAAEMGKRWETSRACPFLGGLVCLFAKS